MEKRNDKCTLDGKIHFMITDALIQPFAHISHKQVFLSFVGHKTDFSQSVFFFTTNGGIERFFSFFFLVFVRRCKSVLTTFGKELKIREINKENKKRNGYKTALRNLCSTSTCHKTNSEINRKEAN